MENNCGIYMFEVVGGNPNRIGEKYIGQTVNFKNRKKEHLGDLKKDNHYNKKLQNYYNKYGKQSLAPNLFFKCEKDLNFWEKFFIKIFDSEKHGFNLTAGGETKPENFKKRCVLQNILTGEIVEFESILECCKKLNLESSAVSMLLNGFYDRVKNWFAPENNWRPKFHRVVSPYGKIFNVFFIKTFCKEHNILNKDGLPNDAGFGNMLKGRSCSCCGWRLAKGRERKKSGKSVFFKIKSPSGEILEGDNIRKFARDFGLCQSRLTQLLLGRLSSYNGWTKY